MNRSERFFNSVKNKKTAVIGVGVSNTDLIKLFLKKGIDVTVCDRKSQKEMGETYEDLKEVGAILFWEKNILILYVILTL